MIFKIYQNFLIKEFLVILSKITFIFFVLGLIMGILEEINFFSDYEVEFYYPIILVLLNIPSLIYEIFPFIFLLSSQFFFINLMDRDELLAFKNNTLENTKILKIVGLLSFFLGLLIIIIFYNFSAILKFQYLDIKKNFTNDNKYLASITENGLWIKDETKNNYINFINAKKISKNLIFDVDIIQLDDKFEYLNIIQSKKIDIKDETWIVYNPVITYKNNDVETKDQILFESNFNYERINNLYSNLSSLAIWNLLKLKSDYTSINYSTVEIDYQIQKILSFPFLITVMTLLTSIIMMNIKFQKPKVFFLIFGILISVMIYYINFFLGALGKNEKIPLIISVWMPIILLSIIYIIGVVKINEK